MNHTERMLLQLNSKVVDARNRDSYCETVFAKRFI